MNEEQILIELAMITASLVEQGKIELAADVLICAGKNGVHVLLDSTDIETSYSKTLKKLLRGLGFSEMLRVSKERAADLAKLPPPFDATYTLKTYPFFNKKYK